MPLFENKDTCSMSSSPKSIFLLVFKRVIEFDEGGNKFVPSVWELRPTPIFHRKSFFEKSLTPEVDFLKEDLPSMIKVVAFLKQ